MRADTALVASALPIDDYVGLVKFRYHITFLNVVFGALLFAPTIDAALAARLATLYVSFNVLLYGGIYTMNDLADRRADADHPHKRARPIASGRVSPASAAMFSAACITLGLGTGLSWFGLDVVACYLAILTINVLYSGGGRNLAYVDLVLNGLPHVVRFTMGAWLVARTPSMVHLLAFLLLTIAMSGLRRDIERQVSGTTGRHTLRHYRAGKLRAIVIGCVVVMLVLAALNLADAPGFFAALLSSAVVLLAGGYFSVPIRSRLMHVWIR